MAETRHDDLMRRKIVFQPDGRVGLKDEVSHVSPNDVAEPARKSFEKIYSRRKAMSAIGPRGVASEFSLCVWRCDSVYDSESEPHEIVSHFSARVFHEEYFHSLKARARE